MFARQPSCLSCPAPPNQPRRGVLAGLAADGRCRPTPRSRHERRWQMRSPASGLASRGAMGVGRRPGGDTVEQGGRRLAVFGLARPDLFATGMRPYASFSDPITVGGLTLAGERGSALQSERHVLSEAQCTLTHHTPTPIWQRLWLRLMRGCRAQRLFLLRECQF